MLRLSYILIAILSLIPLGAFSEIFPNQEKIKADLRASLATKKTPKDSLAVLWDLYDLSNRAERPSLGMMIYGTAKNAGDNATQLDIVRQMTVYYASMDSMMGVLHGMAKTVAPSLDRDETLTFINVYRGIRHDDYQKSEESDRVIRDLLARLNDQTEKSDYEKIETLFVLCSWLASESAGEVLKNYYDQLQKLIEKLPPEQTALRNMFYVMTSSAYTVSGDAERAVAANNRLLEIIKELERKYARMGRKYRNYLTTYYTIYRRMLSNHDALTAAQIEDYYNKLIQTTEADPDLAVDFKNRPTPLVHYYMYKKDYAKALPLLKSFKEPKLPQEIVRLRYLVEAARQLGDKETLTSAALEYAQGLEDMSKKKSAERFRELQVLYDVADLRENNTRLSMARELEASASHRNILIVSIIAIILLAALVFFLWRQYRRSKKMAEKLETSNVSLISERDNLRRIQRDLIVARDEATTANQQKNDFINTMAHEILPPLDAMVEYSLLIVDCVDDEKRKYLERFAHNVTHNAEHLQLLINEMLTLSAIESSKIPVRSNPMSVKGVCLNSVEKISQAVGEKVTLKKAFERHADDTVIDSDSKIIEQILTNLLSNAAKFTEEGSITIDYELSEDKKNIVFTIADTGIGIPQGMEPKVFDRFEKLGRQHPGIGLGLFISHHLAEELGGSLVLDESYHSGGARFILTVPAE